MTSDVGPDRDRGASLVGIALVAQFAAVIAASVVAFVFLWDRQNDELRPGVWPQIIGLLPLWAVLLAAVHLATRRNGLRWFGPGPLVRWRDAPWLFVGMAAQVGAVLLYLPFDVPSEDLEKPAKELIDATGGRNFSFAVLAVAVAVGAPIVEELFYRGLVWRGFDLLLRGRAGTAARVVVPIVVSAVWFAGVHLEGLQFPALALVGVICALAARREGRLGPAILVHMGFNVWTVVALGSQL